MSFFSSALTVGLLIQLLTGNLWLTIPITVFVFLFEIFVSAVSEKVDTVRFKYLVQLINERLEK